jgi:hypothetical protein
MATSVDAVPVTDDVSFDSNPLSRLTNLSMNPTGTMFTLGCVVGIAIAFFGIYIIRKKF